MEDKVALITGSSAGIGEAIAISLARLGCKLTIHGTNEERVKNVIHKCHQESSKNYEVSYKDETIYKIVIATLTSG